MKRFAVAVAALVILGAGLVAYFEEGKTETYTIAHPLQQIDQNHSEFSAVLGRFVVEGRVDYDGLKSDMAGLEAYLDDLASVPEAAFRQWSDREQMAFLINLYNAATLKLVLDHYPVESIKKIGGVRGPWKQKVVRLFGSYASLDHLEHDLLRPMGDPRIHFAINCASLGCPQLRGEAFRARDLDMQLEDQTRRFVRDSSKNHFDEASGRLTLSPIFSWFKSDFASKSGSVQEFVAPYLDAETREKVGHGSRDFESSAYDWSLNKRSTGETQ